MKMYIILILAILLSFPGVGQPILASERQIDSLEILLSKSPEDTNKVHVLYNLSGMNMLLNAPAAIAYADEGFLLSQKLNYKRGEVLFLGHKNFIANSQGNLVEGMDLAYQGMELSKKYAPDLQLEFYLRMADVFSKQKDFKNAKIWVDKALYHPILPLLSGVPRWSVLWTAGETYYNLNLLDSAYYFAHKSYNEIRDDPWHNLASLSRLVMAKILFKSGKYDESIHTFKSIIDSLRGGGPSNELEYDLAKLYKEINENDSSRKYALQALQGAIKFKNQVNIRDASSLLAELYRNKDINKAYEYLALSNAMKDSIADTEKSRQMQALQYKDQKAKNDLVLQDQAVRSKTKLNAVLAALLLLAIILFFLWRNNKIKQKANVKLGKAYTDLKSAQAQLIQSEKMASLGELTAGIAHEIQNPLNFVNNFSEVNKELLAEMNEEIVKGNLGEVKAIAKDITDNEEKINHHGKRADAIVKGMLQHSRSSTGVKEPTNINALADEYLRLAYHGLRAKDKSFNATLKTDYDETIGNVSIIPQDIGRVILNLINNALYAVDEKKKQNPSGYEPAVSINTKKIKDKTEIRVTDNGNGIPQRVLDKIFQPFFTTKPTGQGTGLGLSLAYDIVKAHGGEIKVETKEGDGTAFIIQLPD